MSAFLGVNATRCVAATTGAVAAASPRGEGSEALQVAAVGDHLSRHDVHVELHRFVTGRLQLDVVSARGERQWTGRIGEVADDASIVTVDVDRRVARRNLEAHAA